MFQDIGDANEVHYLVATFWVLEALIGGQSIPYIEYLGMCTA